MSISFSGLASGLDTSSWVESLVALKKAKVNTLEEEKKEVQSLQETLTQIKSFFSSFRSMLEKVTDAKFGVASMDLFAQNLAKSSNLEALTASATTEAEEATYNVLVDKLASETKANSNYSYMTTIVQTTTATGDSKLINLGVKTGTIGVTVNGVEHGINITENDTLSTFIEKLKNIGVNASYNEDSGIFSIDVSADAINDIDKTGIKDALHLSGVNEGYTSNSLQTSKTDTIFSAATEITKLSELGVKDGIVTITANGANYSITINGTTTLGEFINELNKNHIDATLDKDGIFTISDAEITNEGTTDIKNALGLDSSIYGKTQITGNLTHQTTITQTTLATSDTLLKDLEGGENIKDGDTVIVKNSNNEYTTITVGTSTTLGNLLGEISNAGLYAARKADGTIEITGGTIEGGTFKAEDVLGLTREPYSAIVTGKPLTETVEVHKLVDLQTKLVDDLKVKEGYLEVTDANGDKYYEKIYSGQTIADFMTDMGNLGIQTSLDEETGVLTITGGAFKTLSDADVKALVANATIVEPDTRYQQGTNLLACLYGADTISTDQITVASTYSKTKALRHTVTNTINATKNTTLDKLGLSANGTATFDIRGESRTINLTTTMTISDLMSQLKDAGIGSSFNEDTSRLTIENATITGGTSDLATVLDLTTTISGKYVTSSELYVSDTITVDATRDTLLKDYGISDTMTEFERTLVLYDSGNNILGSTTISEGTTLGELIDWINTHDGVSANLKDGYLTINGGFIQNDVLRNTMGLTVTKKSSLAIGSVITTTTTAAVTGETTLGSIFSTLGTLDYVKDGYNLKFNGKDISVSASTTLNELINAIYENGGTASLDHTGRLSVDGGTLTGSVAQALGMTSYTHTASVSATGEKLYVTENVYADRDTKLSDLGITGETSYTIYNSLGQATTTVNLANTATIGDFLDGLKTNGIDGIIANGVIKLDSAEGNYIQGALATTLGLTTQTVTEVVSTTQMSTAQVKHTATLNADLATTMGELGVADPDNVFNIYDKNDQLLASFTITDTSTTIEDFFNDLKAYDIVGSINNGVISLYSPSGNYITGTLADKLGITTAAGENRTMTIGTTVTSTIAVTYTQDVKATENSLISDYITFSTLVSSTGKPTDQIYQATVQDKQGNVLGTISVYKSNTFGEIFRELGEYGIDADIHDGVIKLTSPEGNIISGGIADALGIVTQTITTTKTVGAYVMSTAAVTYTSTVTASLTTKISDITRYNINGTITADGVTGTIIGISTAEDLVNLSNLVNDGYSMYGKTFIMTNDIDMSSVTNWTAIGKDYSFYGNFDGQGYTIRNFNLNNSDIGPATTGLFGTVINATLKNIKFDNITFENTSTVSAQWTAVAILAESARNSYVSNIQAKNVSVFNAHYAGLVNGLVGNVTIQNCSTDVTWSDDGTITSSWQVSGIAGGGINHFGTNPNVTITGCSANLNAKGNIFLGSGIITYQGSGYSTYNISDCAVTGSIESVGRNSGNTSINGIIGAYAEANSNIHPTINIDHCYINANLSAENQGYVNWISGGNYVDATSHATINAEAIRYTGTATITGSGTVGVVGIGSAQLHGNCTPDNNLFTFNGRDVTKGYWDYRYAYNSGFNPIIWNTYNGTIKTQAPNSLYVRYKNGEMYTLISVSANDTMETLITRLSSYGEASLSQVGVLTFKGTNGKYITGPLADTLGISDVTSVTTTTVGATMTSTAAITYTSHETATLTTKLGDITGYKIDGTITADGVTGNVIGLSTAQDLVNLAALSKSNDFSGKTFVLTNDIDMSGVSNWQMIGNYTYRFAGTFDGQGHAIRNLKIEDNTVNKRCGLFAYIKNSTIKNLDLSNFTFNLTSSNPSYDVFGALASTAEQSNIQNVNVTNFQATLTNTSSSRENFYAGGLVGDTMHITISDSSTDGSITGHWSGYFGGIAGNLQGNSAVTGCSSNLSIKSTAATTSNLPVNIAGIAGYVGFYTAGEETTIANCLVTGTLDNGTTTSKGGFVSHIYTYNGNIRATLNINNSISNCANASALVAYASKGSNNPEDNSNTTINITNCFGTNSNGTIVASSANAVLNNNNSYAGNCSTAQLLDFAKATNYNTSIWDLNNLSLKGTSSSPYALNIFNSYTGEVLLDTTLNADSTIQDVINALEPYGGVTFADGILTFHGDNGAILSGGLAEAFGITVGSNGTTTITNISTSTSTITVTQTVSTTTTTTVTLTGTVGLTTSSGLPVTYSAREAFTTTSSLLSQISNENNTKFTLPPDSILLYNKNDGSITTVSASNATTVQDIVDTLSDYGTASFSNSCLNFSSNNYILLDDNSYGNISGDFIIPYNVADFFGITTSVTTTVETQKSAIRLNLTIRNSTTLYEIYGDGSTFQDFSHSAIMISTPSGADILTMTALANNLGKDVYQITIEDLVNELDERGITMTYSRDSVTINPFGTNECYIADWNDWEGVFGFDSSTNGKTTPLSHSSGSHMYGAITTATINNSTTFGELSGNNSTYTITVANNSSSTDLTFSSSSTMSDVFSKLAEYNISGSISDGIVTFNPQGEYYIIGGYAVSYFKMAGAMYTVTGGSGITRTVTTTTTTTSTISTVTTNTITTTSTVTNFYNTSGTALKKTQTGLLSRTDVTFNELNSNITRGDTIIRNSNGIAGTITITATTTLDDWFTQLAAYDIQAGLDSDGKVTIKPLGDNYISSVDTLIANVLKIQGQNPYTTTITTGHTNTASKTLKEEATRTITSSTTLSELGIYSATDVDVWSPDTNIILDENGNLDIDTMEEQDPDIYYKYSGTAFNGYNTLGDVFTWLASHNISASIFGGKVLLNGIFRGSDENGILKVNDDDYLLRRLNLSTKQADYLTTKTSTTLANTTSDELVESFTKTMKTSTTLGDLGASGTLTVSFTQEGNDVTLTFKADDTVDDMLTALAGYGISGQVVDGKISLTGNKHTHITEISADLKSALKLGDNLSYSTVITEGTTVNTDSNKQTHEDTNAKLTGDTIISSIDGFNNGNGSLIVHKTDGSLISISIDGSKTLDEFFEQISRYGIIGSVDSQGVVTITGVGNAYMYQETGGSNLLDVLKLSNVVTNVKTVTVNRTSDTLSHVATVAAKGTTTLENLQDKTGQSITFDALGKAGLILHAYSDAGNTFVTLNFSKTDTIYDVIDKLAEYGIEARLDADGRFSVSSSTLTDFDLSGDLGTFLMGTYTKNYGKDTTNNVSTLLVEHTITKLNDNVKLKDLGINSGDLGITQEGVWTRITLDVDKTQTIGDFRNLLTSYGFTSFIDDAGRLNVMGVGNSYLSDGRDYSNVLSILGLTNWTFDDVKQQSGHLTDTTEVVHKISMSDKLKDLTNSAGVNLGITAGQIYVYQDGTRSTLNIDINDTLETLAAKLSQYGISVGISQEGKLYFDGNNDSYLTTDGIITANASNILQKFDISGNWSTRYDSTSKNLNYTENEDKKVNGSTKLSDLKDTNGNNLGITTGSFYVYNSGVRNTETITDDMTVNDLMSTLAKYGLVADFDENGVMSVGAYNNTYLATSALAGDNSNIVNTLFEKWNFVNIYKSNHLDIPTDEIRAITRDTKLADINEGTYEAGYITVVKDGVKTNISLTADDTVGTLMDELALYGFESVINDKGQLMIKNTGDSLLQKYDGTGKASNALELLGIDLNNWINTSTYDSKTLEVTSTTTNDVNASRDTLLSELGVSTGEYFIYNNGVKFTAMISSDETLGSFMDTLKSFGIETSLVDGADGSVLTIIGKGDSYIKKSTSTTNASNVVEKLFTSDAKSSLEYKGLEQTSSIQTTFTAATEDTLVSYFDKPWNGSTLTSAGDLTVEVNGQKSTIQISADETFGSLLEKFKALGLEATISKDGQIMIQSGYDTMTILQDGTTSNLLGNINLQYKDDLGGYSASSTVLEATTSDIVEKTLSVANYADGATKMGMLNISDGSLTVYRNGQKATIQIKADETFDQLRTRLSTAFADLDLVFENGYLKIFSKDGKNVEVGSTTDTSNFSAITGIQKDENGNVVSARELYCVNGDSTITTSGIFRRGDITKGTFTIGNAVFTIDDNTTLSGLIAQINSSDEANATAFWDNVDGQFVIKSRSTGAALVNIEAGTSNFTDIMGFTTTGTVDVKKDDGSIEKQQVSKLNIGTQEIGENAKVKINGTTYTATSNTITSDITRIKGLTINLKGLTKDSAVTLKVERDKETLANAVSGVVDSYNELMKNVDEAIASDGDLKNESTLKLIRNQLRNLMTSSDAGTTVFRNLDSIGISVAAASGNNIATTNSAIVSLAFDKDKFLKAYEADQDAVKGLIIGGANNKGIFTKVEDLVESTLKSVSGYFASTETSYANKIKDLDKKITKANRDVDRYKARLEAKFQSMDMLIAQMQQQYSSFLTT